LASVGSDTMPVPSWYHHYQQCDIGDLEQNFNAQVITMIKCFIVQVPEPLLASILENMIQRKDLSPGANLI
jgi:hypothetical protein